MVAVRTCREHNARVRLITRQPHDGFGFTRELGVSFSEIVRSCAIRNRLAAGGKAVPRGAAACARRRGSLEGHVFCPPPMTLGHEEPFA